MNISEQQIASFLKEKKEPEWHTEFRKNNAEHLKTSSLPPYQYGLSILIKPNKVDFEKIEIISKPKIMAKIKHPQEVKVISSHEMKNEEFVMFLNDEWKRKEDDNTLYYFHHAFANDFLFIHIPKNAILKEPIAIDYDIQDASVLSTIAIFAEEGCQARILLTKRSEKLEKNSLASDMVRVIAEANSKVEIVSIQDIDTNAANIQNRMSLAGKDADIKWVDLCLGSHYTKADFISRLKGEGGNSKITVLFSGNDHQRYDLFTSSVHEAPQTTSDILTKGVLNHEAKGLSRGLVKIEENAFGSNGYEKQDCLLLSKEAEADAIPNLEINNHDVRCTHGSTIGQIDQEQVFYLRSRGLSEEDAKQKIIEGYFVPILDAFSDAGTKEMIHASILASLQR